MEIILLLLIVVISLLISLLIIPWIAFMYEYYIDWVIDKQDEIMQKK